MKFIKRILFFISLFVLYIIGRELIELYLLARSLHPIVGYLLLVVIGIAVIYFVIIPIYQILKIPINKGPVKNKEKEPQLIDERIEKFKSNPYLKSIHFDFKTNGNPTDQYNQIIRQLEPRCCEIRQKYVSQLFYTSSISQNGFIDAILILSSSISLVKEIFILYNGRVSNRDLLAIAKRIYYSMAIGASEGIEYATEEIFSKLASESLKSIPFLDKILGSLADGFVNSILLTRISYVTENYCKLTHIKSDRDLSPSIKFITSATKNITADIFNRITVTLRKMAFDKSIDFALVAVNPIGYVLGKTIDLVSGESDKVDAKWKQNLKEGAMLIGNPISYGLGKLISSFRKK